MLYYVPSALCRTFKFVLEDEEDIADLNLNSIQGRSAVCRKTLKFKDYFAVSSFSVLVKQRFV